MKYGVVLLMSSLLAVAQMPAAPSPNPPETLPELVAALPQAVRTGNLLAFGKAFDQALGKHPDSAADSIPALGRDLEDADSEVRRMALVYAFALMEQPDGFDLIRPIANQLGQIIAKDDLSSQGYALELVAHWGSAAPESIVTTVSMLLRSRPKSAEIMGDAAAALFFMRPGNPTVEDLVTTVLTDTTVPLEARREILQDMTHWVLPSAGSSIPGILSIRTTGFGPIRAIDGIASSTTDKQLRDDAISAATRIGPTAVSGIHELLMQITEDASESKESREIARAALATE